MSHPDQPTYFEVGGDGAPGLLGEVAAQLDAAREQLRLAVETGLVADKVLGESRTSFDAVLDGTENPNALAGQNALRQAGTELRLYLDATEIAANSLRAYLDTVRGDAPTA